ncbi:unnamed protein product [Prunus armeniaca]|uniref:Chitinase n=1 Tax=Prunus armeniaca TaxID=36596 RepID=A0A6J5VUS6_PRUAR|nr:unnamed protein product [Prunus armeniaca]
MAFYNTIKHLVSLIALFYVAGAVLKNLTAQSCGCAPEICCSQYGDCGSSDGYWGQGNGTEEDKEGTLALANATEKALQLHDNPNSTVKGTAKSIAVFLATRSYQGLDIQYEGSLLEPYFIGRSRRAAGYEDEKNGHEKS